MPNQYFIEMIQSTFVVEATDTYCLVNRFLVAAKSPLGAIRKVPRRTGCYARKAYSTGEQSRYDANNACVCYFVEQADGNEIEHYSRIEVL